MTRYELESGSIASGGVLREQALTSPSGSGKGSVKDLRYTCEAATKVF